MDISQIQVEEQESFCYQAYNLCYLPIEHSMIVQTLDDWGAQLLSQVCDVSKVGNGTLLVANIWFVPMLEDMFGCKTSGLTGSGVSPEVFLDVAVQVIPSSGRGLDSGVQP